MIGGNPDGGLALRQDAAGPLHPGEIVRALPGEAQAGLAPPATLDLLLSRQARSSSQSAARRLLGAMLACRADLADVRGLEIYCFNIEAHGAIFATAPEPVDDDRSLLGAAGFCPRATRKEAR